MGRGKYHYAYFFIISVCLIATSRASAQATLSLGFGERSFNYAEDVPAPTKSTQSGFIPSVMLTSQQKTNDRNWYALEKVEFAWGNLNYDGTTQEPDVTPVTENDNHSFWIFETTFGRRLFSLFSGGHDLYFYAGANFRIWNRNLANPQEDYNLLQIPVGLRLEAVETRGFSIGVDLSFRPLVYGNVNVNFGAASGIDSVVVPVSFAVGARAEVPIRLVGGESKAITLTPWFEYSGIGAGNTVPLTSNGEPLFTDAGALEANEPASQTYQYGVYLSGEIVF